MFLFYYLILHGLHSDHIVKRLKSCVNSFYSFVNCKLFLKTSDASNPSFHTRTISTDHNYQKSFIKLVAGIVTISVTFEKVNEDFTTGKQNISRDFLKPDHFFAVADHVKTTGHNIKGGHFDILTFEKTDYHCKVNKLSATKY